MDNLTRSEQIELSLQKALERGDQMAVEALRYLRQMDVDAAKEAEKTK